MSKELLFDYSKASSFIREEEIANMKSAVIKKSLQESKRQRKKSKAILMCCW